jgi:periodic tryptophan protein 1
VSSVAWNPNEGTVLLTGGYDHQVLVSDLRVKDDSGRRRWDVGADVEGIRWAANGQEFYVSTEAGQIHKFDARTEGKPMWRLQAHDMEITSFDVSSHIDGLMVTGSMDKTVKLWNVSTSKPSMILSRDLDVGKVFSVGFGPDKEVCSNLVVGGSTGVLRIWDTMSNRSVREGIGKQVASAFKKADKERISSLENDDEGESDEDEGDDGNDEVMDDDEEDDES